jgi:hypothetical protein
VARIESELPKVGGWAAPGECAEAPVRAEGARVSARLALFGVVIAFLVGWLLGYVAHR